jgi:hypothetical protein
MWSFVTGGNGNLFKLSYEGMEVGGSLVVSCVFMVACACMM